MLPLNKWVAEHKMLALVLFSGIEIFVYSFFFYKLDFPLWSIILIDLLLIFINYMFVHSTQNVLLKKPLEALSKHGDPEPLFYATQELLTFKNTQSDRQLLLLNHCAALRELGELQKVQDILKAINIDKLSGTLPITKAVYYNNLSDIYGLMGDSSQAEIWYLKMMQIYRDMPENKFKKVFQNTAFIATAESYFRKGDDDQAVSMLKQIQTDDLSLKAEIALLYAKISLKQNDLACAKANLQYILDNGNRLYAVTIAQKMLDQL